jgi:hypothetical protein
MITCYSRSMLGRPVSAVQTSLRVSSFRCRSEISKRSYRKKNSSTCQPYARGILFRLIRIELPLDRGLGSVASESSQMRKFQTRSGSSQPGPVWRPDEGSAKGSIRSDTSTSKSNLLFVILSAAEDLRLPFVTSGYAVIRPRRTLTPRSSS